MHTLQFTLYACEIPTHSPIQWPVMMVDNAPIHERRKLVKTYKNVLPRKRIVVAKVYGDTYSKIDKKKKRWSRKTTTNVKNLPHKLKGNAERER